MAGRSVNLQNFDGTLKAYDNICSHRQCQIRTQPKGNGILRCPYHSWTYNHAGYPVGIPMAADGFSLAPADRVHRSLQAWQVACCGEFVFVRRGDAGPTLAESLGDFHDELHRLQSFLGEEFESLTTEYTANWKVCIENTLDDYHGFFVHPTTFKEMTERDFFYQYAGEHSKMTVEAKPDYLTKWQKVERLIKSRALVTSNYFQYLVFPTMTIASSFGATFSLQQIRPVSPNSTVLTSRSFFAKSKALPAVVAMLGEAAMAFNRTVFEEDRVICNQVQLGLQQASAKALLSRYEQRIGHFQRSVMSRIYQWPSLPVKPDIRSGAARQPVSI